MHVICVGITNTMHFSNYMAIITYLYALIDTARSVAFEFEIATQRRAYMYITNTGHV
jgi:hypothetical protein